MRILAMVIVCCLLASACSPSTVAVEGPGSASPSPTSSAAPEPSATVAVRDRPDCGDIGTRLRRARRGWVPVRSQDISLLPREPNYIGSAAKPVHTGPWDFLADVPLVLYGPGHVRRTGDVGVRATMADVAPTISTAIGFKRFRASDGRPLRRGLRGGRPPRLVLTVVWDGGGTNALAEHSKAWPFLKKLMRRGVSYSKMELGSTPTNTPPIHTTLGTGAFPRTHGIPSVKMETASGEYIDPYEGNAAWRVRVPTLADVYDRARSNRPKIGVVATVNWHLGMIGHGRAMRGGDRDTALLMDDAGRSYGNRAVYDVPAPSGSSLTAQAALIDARDGRRDGLWRGVNLSDRAARYASPAYVRHQARVLRALAVRGRFGADRTPDLLFTNFKSIDDAGHRWGMTSARTRDVIAETDEALRYLVKSLDDVVGKGRWLVVVTADHGQNLYPEESGGWPISGAELRRDANRALDGNGGNDLVTRITSAGAFVDSRQLQSNDLELTDIARWMAGYRVSENVPGDGPLPGTWKGRGSEPLFEAAIVRAGKAFLSCAR